METTKSFHSNQLCEMHEFVIPKPTIICEMHEDMFPLKPNIICEMHEDIKMFQKFHSNQL